MRIIIDSEEKRETLSTIRALTEELGVVTDHMEAALLTDGFNHLGREGHHHVYKFSASSTECVVVAVRAPVILHHLSHTDFPNEARFRERAEVAIDRGEADAGQ